MEHSTSMRGRTSLWGAMALVLTGLLAGPAHAADLAVTPSSQEATAAPVSLPAAPGSPAGTVAGPLPAVEGVAPSEIPVPVAQPEGAAAGTATAPPPAAEIPGRTGAASFLPELGAAEAREAESQPEGAENPPELVGPNDDQLLKEVEKKVNIVPPEPAIRIAEPAYDIPLELNAKVLDYVEIFQTSRRRNFEQGLVRSKKYEAMMKPVFREYGIPTDLYYLALIESAYNPRAYSWAKAMGIWQFISSTGKIYGLRRNEWVDERCDPEKSTRAAARHLKDLYEELGSWPLVLAAYNAGKGRVQRDIAKAGTNDFWSLPLPAQTRNYVPAFYAALIIAKDPERYGFQPEYEEAPPVDVIEVNGGTRLSLVAALAHTSVDEIRRLNPELRKSCAPPVKSYPLRIPAGRGEELLTGLTKVPPGKAGVEWGTYRVAPGDTLFSIAQRFNTTPEAIRDANRLAASAIHAGDQLTIPGRKSVAGASIPKAPGRVVVSSAVPTVYRVQGGDNPWSIARRFNIALDDLLAWNGLDTDSVLQIGQPVALREPATGDLRTARRGTGTTYEVRKGDNLWEIARKFDASVDEIRRANGFSSGHRLQIGDRVVIPSRDNL